MTKGIFLAAFGKKGYLYAAANMAASIRSFNKEVKIAFAYDENLIQWLTPQHLAFFDVLIPLKSEEFCEYGRIDPARFKTAIYDYLPFDENLILDVDGVVLKDIEPLITYLSSLEGFFFTDWIGKGKKEEKIEYMLWTSNNYLWEHFKLKEDQIAYAVQTSFSYVKKCKESKAFFKKLKDNYKKGIDKRHIHLWGGTIPDELFYTGTLAQLNIDPSCGIKPVFFGNYFYDGTYEKMANEFFVLSLYGNGQGRTETKLRYIEYYDKLMRTYYLKHSMEHIYKSGMIMCDKHCNNK